MGGKCRVMYALIRPQGEDRMVHVRGQRTQSFTAGYQMTKKRSPRKHAVRASIQVHELSKAGTSIEFEIYASGEKIGTLVIGRGSLTWRGGKRQKEKTITWTRFAEMMDELAYGDK